MFSLKQSYSISFTTTESFDAKTAEMLRRDIAKAIIRYGGNDISVKHNGITNESNNSSPGKYQPNEQQFRKKNPHENAPAKVFTDGSCLGNPGAGGWAAIIRIPGNSEKKISGGTHNTTNNRMEITGVIESVKFIPVGMPVIIYTDSKYVVDAFNKRWIDTWKKNGWKNSKGSTVLNIDLWQILLKNLDGHPYTFVWIKGHDSCKENEECDKMAVAAAKKIKNS